LLCFRAIAGRARQEGARGLAAAATND